MREHLGLSPDCLPWFIPDNFDRLKPIGIKYPQSLTVVWQLLISGNKCVLTLFERFLLSLVLVKHSKATNPWASGSIKAKAGGHYIDHSAESTEYYFDYFAVKKFNALNSCSVLNNHFLQSIHFKNYAIGIKPCNSLPAARKLHPLNAPRTKKFCLKIKPINGKHTVQIMVFYEWAKYYSTSSPGLRTLLKNSRQQDSKKFGHYQIIADICWVFVPCLG